MVAPHVAPQARPAPSFPIQRAPGRQPVSLSHRRGPVSRSRRYSRTKKPRRPPFRMERESGKPLPRWTGAITAPASVGAAVPAARPVATRGREHARSVAERFPTLGLLYATVV
jgi:hypothetical protein